MAFILPFIDQRPEQKTDPSDPKQGRNLPVETQKSASLANAYINAVNNSS